jgi:hypothetical protein
LLRFPNGSQKNIDSEAARAHNHRDFPRRCWVRRFAFVLWSRSLVLSTVESRKS